jgi:hypothetical protein
MPLISIAIARNMAFRQPRTAFAEPWPLELPKIVFAVWRAAIVASLRYRAANREKWLRDFNASGPGFPKPGIFSAWLSGLG